MSSGVIGSYIHGSLAQAPSAAVARPAGAKPGVAHREAGTPRAVEPSGHFPSPRGTGVTRRQDLRLRRTQLHRPDGGRRNRSRQRILLKTLQNWYRGQFVRAKDPLGEMNALCRRPLHAQARRRPRSARCPPQDQLGSRCGQERMERPPRRPLGRHVQTASGFSHLGRRLRPAVLDRRSHCRKTRSPSYPRIESK